MPLGVVSSKQRKSPGVVKWTEAFPPTGCNRGRQARIKLVVGSLVSVQRKAPAAGTGAFPPADNLSKVVGAQAFAHLGPSGKSIRDDFSSQPEDRHSRPRGLSLVQFSFAAL